MCFFLSFRFHDCLFSKWTKLVDLSCIWDFEPCGRGLCYRQSIGACCLHFQVWNEKTETAAKLPGQTVLWTNRRKELVRRSAPSMGGESVTWQERYFKAFYILTLKNILLRLSATHLVATRCKDSKTIGMHKSREIKFLSSVPGAELASCPPPGV
jgi:hypothetical protein